MWAGLVKSGPHPEREKKFAMKKNFRSALTLGLAAFSAAAMAQGSWSFECIDPANTTPFSTDWGQSAFGTDLIGVACGVTGTVAHGISPGLLCRPQATLDAAGRFAFGVFGGGSVQTTFDDGMAYTMGWDPTPAPFNASEPAGDYNYALITGPDGDIGTAELFGEGGVGFFSQASDRKALITSAVTNGQVQVEVRVAADAVRMRWRFVDTGGVGGFGLVWVMAPWMRIGGVDYQGFNQSNSAGIPSLSGNARFVDRYTGFIAFAEGRPLRTEKKREITDQTFPAYLRVMFGQTDPYGMRLDNTANSSTPDASSANFVKVGNFVFTSIGNTVQANLTGDPTGQVDDNDILLTSPTIVQRFAPTQSLNGQAQIIHYVRSNWSTGFYFDPYTAILDAPRAVHYNGAGGGQTPDPMIFRIWIDNQYATIDKEVDLVNVSAQINLPAGLSLAPGEPQTKNIARIATNAIDSLEWRVVSDGETFGDLPVSVSISTVPGPTRTLSQTVRIAANPVISFNQGPNMISLPYSFGDSSFDGILGLTTGVDYVAYLWDAALRAYVPTTSAQRGIGYWVIPNSAQASLALQNAQLPSDQGSGGILVNLKPGWNMIGNPYNYAVPIRQLLGVPEDNNTEALTWDELVVQRFVSSTLTFFQPNSSLPGGGSYVLQPDSGQLEPHRAYWIFVNAAKDVRLVWPPLFQEGLPNSGRSVDSQFDQSDREWRLQLSARSNSGVDSENFVGVISDRRKAELANVRKAPEAPGSKLEMAVIASVDGQPTRMAQAVADRAGRQEYKLVVNAKEAGDVTITWPNLPSIPRNMRVKLDDPATGTKRDLRASSGYTFRMDQPGTREFTLTVEKSGSSRPTIGNVIVGAAGRDASNSPITISYSLSTDALVTVRILSGTGKEVYTVTRSRSDSAGENTATWTLKDNANRSVAPGTYSVEILAETPNGERVRKIVPVNVIR
ncbi:hypothetical protein CCB80_01505 [Armatimonadetes bacterium Uphvl-Ar1]|nr:hypothetical protein CCB80_01505 [Armatimonadetes bacterium Uphvl-Ar1]